MRDTRVHRTRSSSRTDGRTDGHAAKTTRGERSPTGCRLAPSSQGFGGNGPHSGAQARHGALQFAQAQNCRPHAQHCRPRAQAWTHPPGAGTSRPRLGLAWVSCGLGVVKRAATVPGMAAWVFCNRCFQPPRRTACFSLTSCGHVYCAGCLSKCGWGHGRRVVGSEGAASVCGSDVGAPQAAGQAHRSSEEHVPKTGTKGQ